MEWGSSLYIITLPGLVTTAIVLVEIKNVFDLLRELTWLRIQKVVWPNGFKYLIVSHHLVATGSSDTTMALW